MKSDASVMHFGEFMLDPANRLLTRAGVPVDLGGRYLDTLILLVRERGQLVSKSHLHDEVWRGVPVTDEALSQAIMALRRTLGDDAARPRFIETVPRHGYRFVAQLQDASSGAAGVRERSDDRTAWLVGCGALGAAAAGGVVGLVYGVLAAGIDAGRGLSLDLVLICVSMLAALASGLGIAGGIGLLGSVRHRDWWRPILGGAIGGLTLGGLAALLGLDAFRILTGTAPTAITGAAEGLIMGLTVGIGLIIARNSRAGVAMAGVAALGAIAGAIILGMGGTLMAGSLKALVASFPETALARSAIPQTGWMLISGVFEGAVFALGCVAGMVFRRPQVRAAQ